MAGETWDRGPVVDQPAVGGLVALLDQGRTGGPAAAARPVNRHVVAAGLAVVGLVACTYTRDDETTATTIPDPTATTVAGAVVTTVPATTTTLPPVPDLGAVVVGIDEVAEFDAPVALASRAGDAALYIGQRDGVVRRVEVRTNALGVQTFRPPERTPTIDLTDDVAGGEGEAGLLGLAFNTDGNRIFASFAGTDGRLHLVELAMAANRAEPRSRRELLVVEHPGVGHQGGMLAIGPDGFLYWGVGDGGGAGDPLGTGQDPGDLLGSILRIDPDVAPEAGGLLPYGVPAGNPFVAGGGAGEVWAYGLQDPRRFTFDRATGDLWVADGGPTVEEIDFLPSLDSIGAGRGANLGWPLAEGDRPVGPAAVPPGATPPVFVYGRAEGCGVAGGHVYRGRRITTLVGVYLFADRCQGRLRAIVQRDGTLVDQRDLGVDVPAPVAFGEASDGEVYVLSARGPVYRILATG